MEISQWQLFCNAQTAANIRIGLITSEDELEGKKQYMIAMHSALDNNAARVALSPLNLRETYLLLLQSSPSLADQLQEEIKHQRRHQGPLAEEYLGLNLNIETIGQVIVELTKLGEAVLHNSRAQAFERNVMKELIKCWLSLAEWMLIDIEIEDCKIH